VSWKLCSDCERDPDPRGPSACAVCREIHATRFIPAQIPQHVARLSRALDDHIKALLSGGRDDAALTELALDGAVQAYCQVERLGEDSPALPEHVVESGVA